MDERRSETDDKVAELYVALLGDFKSKGAIRELREQTEKNERSLEDLLRRFLDHEADQRKRDERTEERGKEVRGLLLNVAERSVIALIGALGGAWVAIQALFSGKPH
jgi:hypothetical protein